MYSKKALLNQIGIKPIGIHYKLHWKSCSILQKIKASLSVLKHPVEFTVVVWSSVKSYGVVCKHRGRRLLHMANSVGIFTQIFYFQTIDSALITTNLSFGTWLTHFWAALLWDQHGSLLLTKVTCRSSFMLIKPLMLGSQVFFTHTCDTETRAELADDWSGRSSSSLNTFSSHWGFI